MRLLRQAASGSAPAPQTLGTFAQQVLNALVPDQESILKLAGMAGNGAAQTERVPGEGNSGGELIPLITLCISCLLLPK